MKKRFYLLIITLISKFTLNQLEKMANYIGFIAYVLIKDKRQLINRNLNLCFPEKNKKEIKEMTKQHFKSLSRGLLFATKNINPKIQIPIKIIGKKALDQAIKEQKAIIFIYGHFTLMEICIKVMSQALSPLKISAIYTPPKNKVSHNLIKKLRKPYVNLIPKNETKKALKVLQKKEALVIAPDQYLKDHKRHKEVPFFNHRKKIISATSTLTKNNDSVVFFMNFTYDTKQGFTLTLKQSNEIQGSSQEKEAKLISQFLQESIKKEIPNYLWIVNQFKLDRKDYRSNNPKV